MLGANYALADDLEGDDGDSEGTSFFPN